MDLITIGIVATVIVLAACFVIFKLLSRETTFEEAYGDNAIKLLANQPVTEKTNKKDKHKHKPKRKQSPKNETLSKSVDDEVVVEKAESPFCEPSELDKKVEMEAEVKKSEDDWMPSKQKGKMEKQKQKGKSKSPSTKVEVNMQMAAAEDGMKEISEGKCVDKFEELEKVKEEVVEKGTSAVPTEAAKAIVRPVDEKVEAVQHSAKKTRKHDLSVPRVVERLKEIGELEPEYITYLQGSTDDVMAKENKLRSEIKEIKMEKNELEKKLKQTTAEFDNLRVETLKIMKEKKEQNDRHVIFEQTVRQKLVETVQLKEESRKLSDLLGQSNSKLAQAEQHFGQKIGLLNFELTKAREDGVKHKNYADAMTAEAMKAKHDVEESMRNMRINFEGTLKTLQTELSKEREQRIVQDKEYQMTKNMMDQLMADVSNSQNQLKDAVMSKSVYDDKIQALQNEINREKDHHMQVMLNAQNQLGELTHELEKALVAYSNLAQQQSSDSAKCGEMTARIKQLNEEISHLKTEAKSTTAADELKNSLDELTKCLDEQKARNQDLRNDNYKLMDNIKKMQSDRSLLNGGPKAEVTDSVKIAHSEQLDKLTAENQNFKHALDSVKNQLDKVSRVAEEVEREKDAEIAKLRLAAGDQ
uniref:Kinectin n=1 Tax=Globodera pallida TaxID=36090 RepID=A0A183BJD8_GLOPA